MAFVEWLDAYKIGHETIDSQHKNILEKINKLHDYVYGNKDIQIKEHVDFFLEYSKQHLKYEEDFMEENHYPDFENHKNIHYDFKKKTIDLVYKYNQTEITYDDILSTLIFLKNWWINHITVVDKNLVPFIALLNKKIVDTQPDN